MLEVIINAMWQLMQHLKITKVSTTDREDRTSVATNVKRTEKILQEAALETQIILFFAHSYYKMPSLICLGTTSPCEIDLTELMIIDYGLV